jgi:2-oxoglutarate dehydrogenase E1 component
MNRDEWEQNSYLAGCNAPYIEELYDAFLEDPASVEPKWQDYFATLKSNGAAPDIGHEAIRNEFRERAKHWRRATVDVAVGGDSSEVQKNAYRRYGHYSAHINPLQPAPKLDHHLSSDAEFNEMREIYCGSIGFEYTYIDNDDERMWLQNYIEHDLKDMVFSSEDKKKFLWELVSADGLEKYLDVRYVGQKRFSVEGNDSLIPMMRELTECAARDSMRELVIAMAHRGRLNVLINAMGRASGGLFDEFDGTTAEEEHITGDVKYHRGFSSDIIAKAGDVHLSLMFNPSHLEFINTVAMGSTRARQDKQELHFGYAMPVIMHGDAAFSGQGIVQETLSMSQTRAYTVGGSLHIIINNQVGFTTSDPRDMRSSHYCSDPGKFIGAPIIHVNADDVEAVIKSIRLAFNYRQKFHKDVVIDLIGYRRHGHQEVDEPRATQPVMYSHIKSHPIAAKIYAEQLIQEGVISQADFDKMINDYRDLLDRGEPTVAVAEEGLSNHLRHIWSSHLNREWNEEHHTNVSIEQIKQLATVLTTMPDGMKLHRNVQNIIDSRKKMAAGEQPLDWGFGEMMAYATLLSEGMDVRITGEDVRRGTFYHRHARQVDQNTNEDVIPLVKIAKDNNVVLSIYDSLLSETGTMGFEYGYSTADPKGLIVWEGQFGDFANVAQVIIDQFISSGSQKWNRYSGLVLLLPHGYEGMGPEHSSARLERYLQLCAQDNLQVCVPSTPSQIFHLLRRQVVRHYRKPLIVMTPKSLLRHKSAVSSLDDLVSGTFKAVMPERDEIDPAAVKRIVFCSGKVYYELLQKRRDDNRNDVAIVRIEQLYPFPYDGFRQQLQTYPNANELVWCQEEPKNQGAWFWLRDRFAKALPEGASVLYAGRNASAAPACGYPALHKQQQEGLVAQAFSNEFNSKDTVKF